MVDIVEPKHIRRKQVFKANDGDNDGGSNEKDNRKKFKPIPPHPGIKAGTFKKGAGTGFEEAFADAPITPKEHKENQQLYDVGNDFPIRIGYAIERFAARRRFTSQHHQVFNAFLAYGGIYTASRIGQGDNQDGFEGDDLTKEQELDIFSKFDVEWEDKIDGSKWDIDFEGVAKGYLSYQFPIDFDDYGPDRVDLLCAVMTSFYNFLLIHSVCPEHNESIKAALHITVTARSQLKKICSLNPCFPTPFHKASLLLFDEGWKSIYTQNGHWEDEDADVMQQSDARLIVGAALMAMAPDDVFAVVYPENSTKSYIDRLKLSENIDITLEVVAIERATNNTKECYAQSGLADKKIDARPLGKLCCRLWPLQKEVEYDLLNHMMPNFRNYEHDSYTFWLEDDILDDCFVDMKIKAKIRALSISPVQSNTIANGTLASSTRMASMTNSTSSIWIIDTLSAIYCSFYTFLLNSISVSRKSLPKFLDETACFSCDHPQAEEVRMYIEHERREMSAKEAKMDRESCGETEGVGLQKHVVKKRGVIGSSEVANDSDIVHAKELAQGTLLKKGDISSEQTLDDDKVLDEKMLLAEEAHKTATVVID